MYAEQSNTLIRFYHEYLVSSANEKHSNGVLNAQYEDAVYKKSLPSLLFLSFGICLLNSVNEIMTRRGVREEGLFFAMQFTDAESPALTTWRAGSRRSRGGAIYNMYTIRCNVRSVVKPIVNR